ncbi:siderophore-interacting protein [Nesterenkonia sphaerica]|uniref:Siderophore-interacting protein n=1 Tax=Nesterenkonia sphaerica TaxID=1804988 RepID=A0A5R9AJN0_9MICC|nr:siderophore-interacting protein [Nesterenkonia sphaerica]TLP78982.1 siderophore-interacting protein [Nesterenkonia sphaerica]
MHSAALPPTRAFLATVSRVTKLSPHYLRVTFAAPDLRNFGPAGAPESPPAWDQRIKLFLPRADGGVPDIGLFDDPPVPVTQWYNAWRQLDGNLRNPIRTYTARQIRTSAQELDVDFVIHADKTGASGPAATWALNAQPDDELVIIGPDRRAQHVDGGIDFTPGTARDLLLAGDETAVPAICSILETLPEEFHGEAFLEVPSHADILPLTTRSGVRIHWLPREGAPVGALLNSAVQAWGERRKSLLAARAAASAPGASPETAPPGAPQELPEVGEEAVLWETSAPEGFQEYAWLAGEAGAITGLRRHLVQELGLSRKQVSFMGYWKLGRPGA